jgi:gamma-glutamyltranspeptidase/glutathione hydrolase
MTSSTSNVAAKSHLKNIHETIAAQARRPVAVGQEGMVASAHPLATFAGIDVLKKGGTAADAAVAVNAVLHVTQPPYCGMGGDFFCLYYDAAAREVFFLNGAGRSGSSSSLVELYRRGLERLPKFGPASVVVPGCVGAWGMLLDRFGTKPLGDLLTPAIHYAEKGFPITPLISQVIAEMAPVIDDPEWRKIFLSKGAPPRPGDSFAQPGLARSLAAVADRGTDVFYKGWIAEAIARRLETEGFLTREDLALHAGDWGKPLAINYRGCRVYEPPPPTPGIAVLLALKLLEGFDLQRSPFQSAEHLHLMIEVSKLAYMDHQRYLATPDTPDAEIQALLSEKHAAELRKRLNFERAAVPGKSTPVGDTTGFVITDRQGNMISAIQSIFSAFGSGVVAEGTGIVLHNRGTHFATDPLHPNCLAPRKRPFHTLIAAMVMQADGPLLGFSTMGANGQAQQIHTQVLTNVLDYGLDVQEAIERPRFIFGPPGRDPDLLWIESRMERAAVDGLARRGHRLEPVGEFFSLMGHSHAVMMKDGNLLGGADPRGNGLAQGY